VRELLLVPYLRGLSTSDFRERLAALLGGNAAGLSPAAIMPFASSWQEEYRAWTTRSLADRDCVYRVNRRGGFRPTGELASPRLS
jgi:hypothetical protein